MNVKPGASAGDIFLFIRIVLNLAVFSGGGGGPCSGAEHLQTVKFSRAAGNLFPGLVASEGSSCGSGGAGVGEGGWLRAGRAPESGGQEWADRRGAHRHRMSLPGGDPHSQEREQLGVQ